MSLRLSTHRSCVPPGWHKALLATCAVLLAPGCRPKPACDPKDAKGCVIDKLRILQHPEKAPSGVSTDEVAARLATAESSLLVTKTTVAIFGEKGTLFFRYERFDQLVLERDLERVQRYYRARGFYEARVRAGRAIRSSDSTVTVEIAVDEGPPTKIANVELSALDPGGVLPNDPPDLMLAVADAKNTLEVGKPFEEDIFERAKAKIVKVLTDRGYAYANVTGSATVDLETHSATVKLVVEAGPPCKLGAITFDGLGDLPEAPLRAAMGLVPGRRFSTEKLDEAQSALSDFGVLSSITMEVTRSPDGAPRDTTIPVRIVVQRALMRAIQVGGGGELGGRVQAHVLSSWEHKNFFGGLRRFSVSGRAGVLFHPLQLLNWNVPAPGVRPLPDIRTQVELRQPGFLEARTSASFRIEASFYRPDTADATLTASTPNLFENLEIRGVASLDRPFWRKRFRAGTSLNVQLIDPLAVYGVKPQGFDLLAIPSVELRAALDLRKDNDGKLDPLNPHSGVYVGASVQAAAIEPDGGADIRLQPEVRGYVPVSREVTLAFRAAGGILFPFNYGQQLSDSASSCGGSDSECARALQIMQLRGFYSGGINSNRGYGYNGVNPQRPIPSVYGSSVPVPIGGRYLWNASLELRFPIYGSFGGAFFVDASDVWNDKPVGPHLSPGLGLRYATPIGPARLDLGVRVPCAQRLGLCTELSEGAGGLPQPLGLPVYIAIAIGEAF